MAKGLRAGDRVWLFVWGEPDGSVSGTVEEVGGRGFGRWARVRWDDGGTWTLKTSDLAREGHEYELFPGDPARKLGEGREAQ